MKKIRTIIIAAAALMLSGCGEPTLDMVGMVDGQSPDTNVRMKGGNGVIMVTAPAPRIINIPTSEYKVYVGTDMHIDTNAPTTHTDSFLKAYTDDPKAPMAIILGDLVNGKSNMQMASERVREMAGSKLESLFMTLGNHDIYFKLWDQWTKEWGSSHYTVEVHTTGGTDFYICLDSASGYLGTEQMSWLKDVFESIKNRDLRHIIVFTHTHMFKKDGSQGHTSNYPIEETWELTSLFARNGVELFLSGHSHSRDISHFNGVQYVVVDALEEHYSDSQTGYMILEAGKELDCRFIRFDEIK